MFWPDFLEERKRDISKESSGKYLPVSVSQFVSVSETFSIKASLSCTIPNQVSLLRARIKFSAKILLPAVFRWIPNCRAAVA